MPLSFPVTILERSKCSVQERLELIPVIQRFQRYVHQARREGSLCLEQYLTVQTEPNLHHIGIRCIVTGCEAEDVTTIFMNIIQTSHQTGQNLLRLLLIAEGFHCICKGKSKGETLFLMLSLLGDELCSDEKLALLL